jgi:hypothetical protein
MSKMLDSKSLLAKLMATENITIEQRKVDTAYFDLKNRVLCLPILKSDLHSYNYDHFIGHEVGHAHWTPIEYSTEAKKLGNKSSVLNVVEDARIERKIKYKYPGLKNSFFKSYNDLIERNFFGTQGKNINSYNFIDRANMYLKGGPAQGIEFTDEELKYINKMNETESFEDVVKLTYEIINFLKEEIKHSKTITVKFADEDSEEQDDGSFSTGEEGEPEEGEETGQYTGTSNGQEGDEEGDSGDADESDSAPSTGGGASNDFKMTDLSEEQIDQMIKSITDEMFKENEKKLFEDRNVGQPVYANIPKFDLTKHIYPYDELYKAIVKSQNYSAYKSHINNKYQKELGRAVSYMVKEFELRKNAEQHKRAKVSKTGELNMSRVYTYNFSDDIFKKITTMPDGKSHGLVMFLDWSGSMRNSITNTIRQMLALVLFCRKVNIPFEVYAFTSGNLKDDFRNSVEYQRNCIVSGNFSLYNIFSSKMNSAQLKLAASIFGSEKAFHMSCRVMSMEGTPLNETIIAAMDIVPQFKKQYNLQIVNTVFLTDGDSGGNYEYVDSSGSRKNMYTGKLTIRDTHSKIEEVIHEQMWRGIGMTEALIRMLKRKTEGNVIGFFIVRVAHVETAIRKYSSKAYDLDDKEFFRKNKYLVLNTRCFDEYYLLKDESIDDSELDFNEVEVKSSASRSIVSSFTKFNRNRLEGRVVLNRFIELIA